MAEEKKEPQSGNQLEGEGSYTGTRDYNRHLTEHQREQDVDALAEQAQEALQGEEGEELRRAEEEARQGPRSARPSDNSANNS